LQPLVGACRRYSDGDSKQKTRKAEFRAEVDALCEDLTQYSVGAQVLMLTAHAMAAKGDVGSTVERQVVGELRGFLADVGAREPAALTSLETIRESADRVSEIARDIIEQRVAAGTDADNLRAVLGHMRTACDIPISLGEAPPAAGSSKPVPCMWRDEVADQVRQALLSMDLVEAVKSRALALLALVYAAAALRASEVHGLRVRDVAFIGHDVVLSISNPAVNIKSPAGRREVQVAMPVAQAADLRSLVEDLRAAARDDALLFGETTAPAEGVRAQDVQAVLQAAIAMVGGDARASTLTLRRSAATKKMLAVLLPREARDADFLHRRQACFYIAIGVGHASIWTTITDYFSCMADALFEHMARRPAGWSADVRKSRLLATVIGGKANTAEKRAERNRSTGTSLVLQKDLRGLGDRLDPPAAAKRVGEARSGSSAREDRGARLRFFANVLSGMPADIAGRLDCVFEETMVTMKRKRSSYKPSHVRLTDADRAQILPIATALAPLPELGSVIDVLLPAGTARGASCVIVGEHNLAQLKLLLQALASIGVTTDLRLSSHASEELKAAAVASKVARVLPGRKTPSDYADVVSITFASKFVKGAGAASRLRALVCAALLDLVLFS
jgi:site-specific recombinase XerC